ncbi:MAG: hypothetical protein ACK5KP_07465 [Paludibacteraceae bacterium]
MTRKIFIILLLSLFVSKAVSQNTIYKVSKTADYRFEDCSLLRIQGEKATIRITGHRQNTIELKIILVAKHKNQTIARNDLKFIRFDLNKKGSVLYLKNFYESGKQKIESNLSIVFELTVPEAIAVDLQNLYGRSVSYEQYENDKRLVWQSYDEWYRWKN